MRAMPRVLLGLALAIALVACSGLEERMADLRERVENLDLNQALSTVTDCDRLSDVFVGVVREAAGQVDRLAERSGVDATSSEFQAIVDEISVSNYYEWAEQLGCARIQAQLDLVDKLADLQTDTPAGESFVDGVIDNARSG